MVIKCSFLPSLESARDYAKHFADSAPLPEYITKTGPHVNNKEGRAHQIITIYKFDRSKFTEAWECIFKKIDVLRSIPGFTLSVRILKKRREFKGYRISPKQKRTKPFSQPLPIYE